MVEVLGGPSGFFPRPGLGRPHVFVWAAEELPAPERLNKESSQAFRPTPLRGPPLAQWRACGTPAAHIVHCVRPAQPLAKVL